MTQPARPSDELPKAAEAFAEVVAVSAGLAAGGPAGAIIGAAATPYILGLVQRSWNEISSFRQQSVTGMVVAAAENLQQDPQQMVDAALATDAGTELLADALRAAADTINIKKVAALARALANGLDNDQALVDEERLVIRALADIEEPHLAFLTKLAGDPMRFGSNNHRIHYPRRSMFVIQGWYAPHGQTAPKGLVTAIMHTLERNGLIEENLVEQTAERDKLAKKRLDDEIKRVEPRKGGITRTRYPSVDRAPERRWNVTDFGGRVLDHLEAAATPDHEAADQDGDSGSVSVDGAE